MSEIKRLYVEIDRLQKDLDEIVRMKTGFFRGISKKEREQKEMAAVQALSETQRMLELAMLDFTEAKKRLRDEFENKRDPLIHQIKNSQKKAESHGSRRILGRSMVRLRSSGRRSKCASTKKSTSTGLDSTRNHDAIFLSDLNPHSNTRIASTPIMTNPSTIPMF